MNTKDLRLSERARMWLGRSLDYNYPISDLDEYGVYHIRGEDPNCDFGGHHHEPDLGFLEGPLWAVINDAVEIHGFFSWGAGGKVLPVFPRKVRAALSPEDQDALDNLKALEEKAVALRDSLKSKGILPE